MGENMIKYYYLENYLFTEVRDYFLKNGFLTSFDFFCIIIWKANRAKSKIAEKLLTFNTSLDATIETLTRQIYSATNDKTKLEILIVKYRFKLPIASAILTVLYPETFTIYDTRVCDTFPKYKNIADRVFENQWSLYSEYIECVRNYNSDMNLRDTDRLLWAKSFKEQLDSDLQSHFTRNQKDYGDK